MNAVKRYPERVNEHYSQRDGVVKQVTWHSLQKMRYIWSETTMDWGNFARICLFCNVFVADYYYRYYRYLLVIYI